MSEDNGPPRKRRKTTIINSTNDEITAPIIDKSSLQTAGKIEKIALKNVLCHSNLVVELNECVNLIQGQNGSGKSSIVASIIAGFGGSAQLADKGMSFKNLIQTGKNQATIEIYLCNQGVNAYKRDLYGDKIIVERKIFLRGSSTYKLKDSCGRVISQKKEDMNRLLFRFSIMVDNPVVILSQEHAKTFLSNATPSNLFKFYMLSTGMQQLKNDYKGLKTTIEHCDTLVKMKTENLQTLRADLKEWQRKAQAIQSLDKKKRKVTLLKIEKSVAELNDLNANLNGLLGEQKKVLNRFQRIQDKLSSLEQEKKKVAMDKKRTEEESQNVIIKVNEMQAEKNAIAEELTAKKRAHKHLVNELRNVEKDATLKAKDVESIRMSLSDDNSQAHQIWNEKNSALAEEKKVLSNRLQELTQMLQVAVDHEGNLQQTGDIANEYNHLRMECQALERRLNMLKRELESFRGNSTNSLSVFNPAMPQIVVDIEHTKNFRQKPVGPIGAHVKCVEQEWMHIAEKILMPLMLSFVVCCKEDVYILKKIFKNRLNGQKFPTIFVTKFRDQVHDGKRFTVQSRTYRTLWSILEVNNIHAANLVLDEVSAQSTLLIPTSREAGDLLSDQKRVPINCMKAYTLRGDIYHPDPKFKIYSGNGNKHVRYLQVSPKEKIRELELSCQATKEEVIQSKEELRAKEEEKRIYEQDCQSNFDNQKKLQSGILRLQKSISDLRDKEELPPPDVFQLQTDLKEIVSQYESIKEKRQEIENKVSSQQEDIQEISQKYKVSMAETQKYLDTVHEIQKSTASSNDRNQELLRDIRRYKDKKTEQQSILDDQYAEKIQKLQDDVKAKQDLLEESDNSAVETDRSVVDIERELTSLVKAIEAQESKVGDLDTILSKVHHKTTHYETIKTQIQDQKDYIKMVKKCLVTRTNFVMLMQQFNEIYIQSCFSTAIAKRSLKGILAIDHEANLLTISVQKATDGEATPGAAVRPLSMMSGGEKSFSTVSFIMALWDIIYSPIRILDEFDVFLDDVARKQVTDLMLSNIKPEFQYMFITPLDYSMRADKFNTIMLKAPRKTE